MFVLLCFKSFVKEREIYIYIYNSSFLLFHVCSDVLENLIGVVVVVVCVVVVVVVCVVVVLV